MSPENLLHEVFAKTGLLMFPEKERRADQSERFKAHHGEAFFQHAFEAIVEERGRGICALGADAEKMLDAFFFGDGGKR